MKKEKGEYKVKKKEGKWGKEWRRNKEESNSTAKAPQEHHPTS